MPKINHEEYDVLKELDDKWKWIARDDNYGGFIFCFRKKPHKYIRNGGWDINTTQYKYLGKNDLLFQFIQWEDEEPYNIKKLIEEYEESREYKDSLVIEYFMDKAKESEETEVKKNIEWLKSAIQQNLDFYNDNDEEWQMAKVRAYAKALDLINQLDEPEVLSQELPVIPKFAADWIEKYIEYGYDLYPALKKMENNARSWERIYDWYRKNTHKFVNAYLTGIYEVEEEQKYYVLDSEDIPLLERANNQTYKTTTGLSIYEDGRDNSRFELTEQEIKDYDPRYLAFKVPVEEVEE